MNDLLDAINETSENILNLNPTIEIPTIDNYQVIYNMYKSNAKDISDEVLYKTVYGEIQHDDKGKLLFPGVVNETKSKIEKSTLDFIDKKKKKIKQSINLIKQKSIEISQSAVQLGVDIGAAAVTIGASATIMPIGSGLPVAFSAVQSVFSSLQSFKTKLTSILPFFDDLSILEHVLESDKKDEIINTIETVLNIINTTVASITSTIGIINSFQEKLPKPPGVGDVPPEKINLEIIAFPDIVNVGDDVHLDVTATKGTWQDYKYLWTSNIDPTFKSTEKSVKTKVYETTKFTIKVIDSGGNYSINNIEIQVNSI
jgi:hypothetical protein